MRDHGLWTQHLSGAELGSLVQRLYSSVGDTVYLFGAHTMRFVGGGSMLCVFVDASDTLSVNHGLRAMGAALGLAGATKCIDVHVRRLCRFAPDPRPPRRSRPLIVALTASALDEDRQRCREAGMQGLLAKPLRMDELLDAMARYARKCGAEPAIEKIAPRVPSPAARADTRKGMTLRLNSWTGAGWRSFMRLTTRRAA